MDVIVTNPDVWIIGTDQFADAADIPDVARFFVTIGQANRLGRDHVSQAVSALKSALVLAGRPGQEAEVTPLLDGFDDDPRELFQIPEARRFIVQVMHEVGIRSRDNPHARRFDQGTLNLLAACGVFGPPPPVFIVPRRAA